jgi:hypothetical protein
MGYRTQNKKHNFNPQNSTLQKNMSDIKLLIMRTVCEKKTETSPAISQILKENKVWHYDCLAGNNSAQK